MKYPNLPASMGQIAVYCLGSTKYVYRCGPNSQFKLDTSPPSCIATCSLDGQRYADPNNPRKYKVCILNEAGNSFTSSTLSKDCPADHIFDAKKNECVPDILPAKTVVDILCPTNLKTKTAAAECPIRTR
jgi:Chitin binding Peritrophin-A domain